MTTEKKLRRKISAYAEELGKELEDNLVKGEVRALLLTRVFAFLDLAEKHGIKATKNAVKKVAGERKKTEPGVFFSSKVAKKTTRGLLGKDALL
jgi:hypothetical protein